MIQLCSKLLLHLVVHHSTELDHCVVMTTENTRGQHRPAFVSFGPLRTFIIIIHPFHFFYKPNLSTPLPCSFYGDVFDWQLQINTSGMTLDHFDNLQEFYHLYSIKYLYKWRTKVWFLCVDPAGSVLTVQISPVTQSVSVYASFFNQSLILIHIRLHWNPEREGRWPGYKVVKEEEEGFMFTPRFMAADLIFENKDPPSTST